MGPTIKPGDEFYDKVGPDRYERCVLQPTDGTEPDRKAAARGGTGEFYRALLPEKLTADAMDASTMIFDAHLCRFVFLEREV